MGFGPARPPVTEGVAEVIAKDGKMPAGGQKSEVPIAFARPEPVPTQNLPGWANWKWIAIAVAVALVVLLLFVM